MTDDLHRENEAARHLMRRITIDVLGEELGREPTDEEAQTVQDTFDGATTLDVALAKALELEDNDLIWVDGIKERIRIMKERCERFEKRIERRRGDMEHSMMIAGWPKYETALGTISMAKSPDKVAVDDEASIPADFWRRRDPELDKANLTAALKLYAKQVEAARYEEDLTLVIRRLPYSDVLDAEVRRAAAINDHRERFEALREIASRYSPVPGAHLEVGGKHLVIRRK